MKIRLMGAVAALVAGLAPAPAGAAANATVAGDWEVSWEGPFGPQTGSLTITLEGKALSGTFATQGVEGTLSGTFEPPNATFTIEMPAAEGGTSKIDVAAVIDGDAVTGTAIDRDVTIPFTGKRKAKEPIAP